jgi:Predicted hydrolase of the metallo-beta-lactamase superfamily
MTRSLLEPHGLKIKTPLGCVLPPGDWECGPPPFLGVVIGSSSLYSLGDEGVLAMICDSPHLFCFGRSGSALAVGPIFLWLFERLTKKIIVPCFASTVARIATIFFFSQKT